MVNYSSISDDMVLSRIHIIRGQKVLLDRDLAEFYGVSTKVFNQAVTRNVERFPDDFMFRLSQDEFKKLRSQIVTSSWGGTRYSPRAFTENGVAMLSSVLNSGQAIKVNIQLIRIFARMRSILFTYKDLLLRVGNLEQRLDGQEKGLNQLISKLRSLLKESEKPRNSIGFKIQNFLKSTLSSLLNGYLAANLNIVVLR